MGNNSSAGDELQTAKADMNSFSPGTPNMEGASTRPRSNSKTRRIVKAAKPSATSAVASNDNKEQDTVDAAAAAAAQSEEEPGYYKSSNKKTHTVPKAIAESPSVARELEIEQQDEKRKERQRDMADRQKAKREKLLLERRRSKKDTTDNLQPNPFSRFLSFLSVEPAHPEHKRAYEAGARNDDDDELNEPDEKRLRPSEDADASSISRLSTACNSSAKTTAVAVGVAVAAVAIIVAFRLGRQA